MEKITKEGKDVENILAEIMAENNLNKEDFIYTSKLKKGKLFQGTLYEVDVYLKSDINNEIKNILHEIVENMGLEVTIEISNKEERTTIRMFSNKDYILIGKEGATLKALEVIVKQRIQNETGIYYKFNLDVSNYKTKIAKHLEWLAKKSAKEVAETKMEIALDNMTSYERRIIHNALTDFKGVKTESEGEEPNRHIVIKPL